MAKKVLTKKRAYKIGGWALIALGFILGLITGALVVLNHNVVPKAPPGSVPAPSSVKPSTKAIANYSVPPTDPKYISIPAINVDQARVVQLGVTKNNQIATPSNIYDTGWYTGSAKPGQSGAMFIFGHVSSWTANGVFYNLKKLKAGDKVTVTRGDNTTYTYQVVSSKVYPYNNVDMNAVLSPVNPRVPGLNLMTCTGQVIKGTSEFNERLVVFTSLVSS